MEVFSGASAVAAVALAVTAFVRYLIVRAALKGTEPRDRAVILRSLATLFRAEWHFGPIRREQLQNSTEQLHLSNEQVRHLDEQSAGSKQVGGSDERAPTDRT